MSKQKRKTPAKLPRGFWEQVHAESLRAVAHDIFIGRMPPPQVIALLNRCADMIEKSVRRRASKAKP